MTIAMGVTETESATIALDVHWTDAAALARACRYAFEHGQGAAYDPLATILETAAMAGKVQATSNDAKRISLATFRDSGGVVAA